MSDRREFLLATAGAAALAAAPASAQPASVAGGTEHWTVKRTPQGDVKLWMWRKRLADAPKGPLLFVHGSSAGALRVGLFAQRHPERIRRIVLDALVYTGEGSPTLAERKKRLPQYRASNRRPINRDFVRSIFTRDGNPDAYDPAVVERFADQVLAMDDSMPTGTYVDMSANLPVLDPAKIRVPTAILRGQWDGIATDQDVINFFARLPNPDKQLTVMPGIAHTSLRSKNWRMVYDIVDACCSRTAPVYTG